MLFFVEDDQNILKKYNLSKDFYIMLQHPVTSEINDSENQILETINAIIESKVETLVVLPNNDAGYSKIINTKILQIKIC